MTVQLPSHRTRQKRGKILGIYYICIVKLSEHNIKTLMLFLQQKIEDNAESISEKLVQGNDTNFLTYIMVPTFLPLSDIRDLIQALINNHTMQEKKYHNRITYPHTFLKFASVYKLACGSSKYAV